MTNPARPSLTASQWRVIELLYKGEDIRSGIRWRVESTGEIIPTDTIAVLQQEGLIYSKKQRTHYWLEFTTAGIDAARARFERKE